MCWHASGPLLAKAPQPAVQVKRVGGDYQVTHVKKLGNRSFLIEFKAATPTGRFDVLRLESDHVHVAVQKGQTLRLSAEVFEDRGRSAEVSQVVLFLPSQRGRVPVWLLSNKFPANDLRGSRYLEMHVPLKDYLVM